MGQLLARVNFFFEYSIEFHFLKMNREVDDTTRFNYMERLRRQNLIADEKDKEKYAKHFGHVRVTPEIQQFTCSGRDSQLSHKLP